MTTPILMTKSNVRKGNCKTKRVWESLKAKARDVSPPLVNANVFLTNQIIKILHNVFGTNNCEPTVSTAKWKWKSLSRVLLFATPWTIQSMEFPGQNTGVGSLSLSRGSSQPRDWTQVSRVAGRFFTSWATREAQYCKQTFNVSFYFNRNLDMLLIIYMLHKINGLF